MGSFFNDLGGIATGAVADAAGRAIDSGETSIGDKFGIDLKKILSPLPPASAAASAAVKNPPINGNPTEERAPLPVKLGTGGGLMGFYQNNKKAVLIGAGVLVLLVVTGVIKLKKG